MDKNIKRLTHKIDRLIEASHKGDRSRRWYTEWRKVHEELDALMPNELPDFLMRSESTGRWLQKPTQPTWAE